MVWIIATELPKEEEWADPSWCAQGGIVGTQSELVQDSRTLQATFREMPVTLIIEQALEVSN